METDPLHFVFLLGCTGCGKGAVGRALAARVGAEIVSVDSMKVYRGMDIGTAKPTAEMRAAVRHHMIDIVAPWEEFSLARYLEMAEAAASDIAARGRIVLAVGGTALYIKGLSEGIFDGPPADAEIRARLAERSRVEGVAALHGALAAVDPAAAERIHRHDLRRIIRALEVHELTGQPISSLQTQWDRARTRHGCTFIGLRRTPADQAHRTNGRVVRLIRGGWVDEVRALVSGRRAMSTTASQATGYRELAAHLRGELSLDEAMEMIKISTRQLAKAQRTWFKRFRRTVWFDVAPDETSEEVGQRILERWDDFV